MVSAGKEMDEGFEYESGETEVENSSRILLRTEKATRTGYSWSVITTATYHNMDQLSCANKMRYGTGLDAPVRSPEPPRL